MATSDRTPHRLQLILYVEYAPEAHMATDEDGHPTTAYGKNTVPFDRILTEDEQRTFPALFRTQLAALLNIPVETIHVISPEAFAAAAEEEEEDL